MQILIQYSGFFCSNVTNYLGGVIRQSCPSVLCLVSDADPESVSSFRYSKTLGQSDCAIVVLTPENRHSEWLLFEVGVLVGSMPINRIFLVVAGMDISDIPIGPLMELQTFEFNENGMSELFGKLEQKVSEVDADGAGLNSVVSDEMAKLQAAMDAIRRRSGSPVKQPAPDCGGSTNTVFYKFRVTENATHKLESNEYEPDWNENVRFFTNYTGPDTDRGYSDFRYAAMAVGYPTMRAGEEAIGRALYEQCGFEIGEVEIVSISTQRIYAAFQGVVEY